MINAYELRDKFIREIQAVEPNMKVHYLSKENGHWSKEKLLSELSISERKEFNLRKQLKNEIILDIEEKYRLTEIVEKLREKQYSYKVFETGSRGYHVSLIFKNLSNFDLDLRNRIRKYIIDYFETDIKLAKESQWVSLEWTPHFKTGNIKKLIESINEGENNISEEIINYCKEDLERQEKRKIENKEIIKNYEKNDPYLNFALNTYPIEGGNRNNVLFKNLAIGLVRTGLSREDIIPFAQKIVANCPGKAVGEFMGWVDKAINEDFLEYNKSELCKWSISRGEKPLYNLLDSDEVLDLLSIKQLWDEIWNNKITSQDVWKDLCFYNMIGTILDEKDRDLRIHVIFSSFSSSGKDEGINLVRDILERLEYKCKVPNTVTDRTLIGAVNQSRIDYNIKWGLDENNPEVKGKVYRDPVEPGWLENTNWIACPEAEFIIKPGLHNRNIQSILRQAMDKARRVDKGVGGYEISLTTNTSFLLTTYSMSNLINNVLHNGLFQRALFYNKKVSSDEHKKIREFIAFNRFKSKHKIKFNENKYIMKLIKKLKEMKIWYYENKQKIEYDSDCDKYVNRLCIKIEEQYANMVSMDREILNSMVRRSIENLYRLSILNVTAKMKSNVYKEDIKECYDLISKCLDSVKILVVSQDEHKKVKYGILKIISNGSLSTMNLHKVIEKEFGVKSPNKRTKMIKQLEDVNYLSTFKIGSVKFYNITDKGREYLVYSD